MNKKVFILGAALYGLGVANMFNHPRSLPSPLKELSDEDIVAIDERKRKAEERRAKRNQKRNIQKV